MLPATFPFLTVPGATLPASVSRVLAVALVCPRRRRSPAITALEIAVVVADITDAAIDRGERGALVAAVGPTADRDQCVALNRHIAAAPQIGPLRHPLRLRGRPGDAGKETDNHTLDKSHSVPLKLRTAITARSRILLLGIAQGSRWVTRDAVAGLMPANREKCVASDK